MNKINQLFRRDIFDIPIRKKISGVNMQMRKEIRRLKKLNIYSRQFTGQQNQHGWFTQRRYKSLGLFLQACRNTHHGNLPIKQQLKKQISEKFIEDSHWLYYKYRNYITQILTQMKTKQNLFTAQQIATLPAHFRDDLTKQQQEIQLPKLVNPVFIFNSQRNIYMPIDERYRFNLLQKIQNPPQNKSQQEEKD